MSRYSLSFKEQVISDYEAGGVSKSELCKRYNIGCVSSISKWIDLHGSSKDDKLKVKSKNNSVRKSGLMVKKSDYDAALEEIKLLKSKLVDLYISEDLKKYQLEAVEELYGKKGMLAVEKLSKKKQY